jgi:signal transduction histidine kinase
MAFIKKVGQMSFRARLVPACGLALLVLLSIGLVCYRSVVRGEEDQQWVEHTHFVLEKLNALQNDQSAAGIGVRGYLQTKQPAYLQEYRDAAQQTSDDLAALRQATADNAVQRSTLDKLTPLVNARIEQWSSRLKLFQQTGQQQQTPSPTGQASNRKVIEDTQILVDALRQEEQRLLAQRLEVAAKASRVLKSVIVFGNAFALLLLVAATVIVYHEIRQRAEAEALAKLRLNELEASNKELEAFSYSVSHDLRAPLRSIDGFSHIVIEEFGEMLGEEGRSHLQRVRAAAQQMAELIDDLINLSRLSRTEMRDEQINLSEMANSVVETLRESDPERAAEISVAPGLETHGDSRLIRTLMENLIGNSWKFAARQQLTRIEVGKTGNNGSSVFFVRDNGAGFNPAHTARLFGAFQRLHRNDEFPGTGIGLASVQRVVQRHGGKIWAESQVNQGATFYFTLWNELRREQRSRDLQLRA